MNSYPSSMGITTKTNATYPPTIKTLTNNPLYFNEKAIATAPTTPAITPNLNIPTETSETNNPNMI